MGFGNIIEIMIKQAVERGEFQNLPGDGKPLKLKGPNPFESKEETLFYRIIKSSGELPIEVVLLKEIESAKQELEECKVDCEKEKLKKKLKELNLKFDIQMEARRNFFNK